MVKPRRRRRSAGFKLLRQWAFVTIGLIVVSMVLTSINPMLLNSNLALLGFLVWAILAIGTIGFAAYSLDVAIQASKVRKIFVERFPTYEALSWYDFLGIYPEEVLDNIELLAQICREEEDLHVSLFELLRRDFR
jgi:hypothetical protein